MYKVILKILANRTQTLLPKLISPNQAAFISGWWIDENSILVNVIVHTMRKAKGGKGLVGIKVDVHKAYDRISWSMLNDCLTLGFRQGCWPCWDNVIPLRLPRSYSMGAFVVALKLKEVFAKVILFLHICLLFLLSCFREWSWSWKQKGKYMALRPAGMVLQFCMFSLRMTSWSVIKLTNKKHLKW